MKKILLVTTAIFLLAGCTQTNNNVPVNEPVSDEAVMGTYNNAEFNISFNYPSDWEVIENKENRSVKVMSPADMNNAGNLIVVTIPSESFEEYENLNKELLAEEKMSINSNSYPKFETELPTKIYGQHGYLYQIIEINGKYISAANETVFSEKEKEGLEEILNSLSF